MYVVKYLQYICTALYTDRSYILQKLSIVHRQCNDKSKLQTITFFLFISALLYKQFSIFWSTPYKKYISLEVTFFLFLSFCVIFSIFPLKAPVNIFPEGGGAMPFTIILITFHYNKAWKNCSQKLTDGTKGGRNQFQALVTLK